MSVSVDLNQVILALTDALDLVGIDETAHGKRVGYMAFICAEHLGRDKPQRERLFNIGLLHDVGVSSSVEHHNLVNELQWDGAQDHATEGANLLASLPLFADYSDAIRYHHTAWQDLQGVNTNTALDANLIFLVDRVDSLAAPHYGKDLLAEVPAIRETLKSFSGTLFAPELVELFLEASSADAFWMMLEPPHLERFILDMERRYDELPLNFAELKQLAGIFAHVVDAKSRFTVQHSYGVASLARHLAELQQLSREQAEKIEIAGLLHDVGKLRIPDEILEKPGPLDEKERRAMRRHSFETYQVLRRIDGLSDIALWAAYHHETTDGMGYPFRRQNNELSIEARIIAVADIFQALAQDRPYRTQLPAEQIIGILEKLAENHKLDMGVVTTVRDNLDSCFRAATLQHAPLYRSTRHQAFDRQILPQAK